jgi:hypothetical protein
VDKTAPCESHAELSDMPIADCTASLHTEHARVSSIVIYIYGETEAVLYERRNTINSNDTNITNQITFQQISFTCLGQPLTYGETERVLCGG